MYTGAQEPIDWQIAQKPCGFSTPPRWWTMHFFENPVVEMVKCLIMSDPILSFCAMYWSSIKWKKTVQMDRESASYEFETLRGQLRGQFFQNIQRCRDCQPVLTLEESFKTNIHGIQKFRSVTSWNDPEICKISFLFSPKILLLVTSATRFTVWIEMGFGQSQSHIPMWIRSAAEQRTSKHRMTCLFHHCHPLKKLLVSEFLGCPCLTSCRFQLVDLSYCFCTEIL